MVKKKDVLTKPRKGSLYKVNGKFKRLASHKGKECWFEDGTIAFIDSEDDEILVLASAQKKKAKKILG